MLNTSPFATLFCCCLISSLNVQFCFQAVVTSSPKLHILMLAMPCRTQLGASACEARRSSGMGGNTGRGYQCTRIAAAASISSERRTGREKNINLNHGSPHLPCIFLRFKLLDTDSASQPPFHELLSSLVPLVQNIQINSLNSFLDKS